MGISEVIEWTWQAGVRLFAVSLYFSGSVLVPTGGTRKENELVVHGERRRTVGA
jgi:hypothetical protein